MEKLRALLISLCALLCGTAAMAQTFRGGMYGGITTSQISGDHTTGFKKIGCTGGLFVETNTPSLGFGLSFGFSQKGSANSLRDFKINLGYMELAGMLIVRPSAFVNVTERLRLKAGLLYSAKAYESVVVQGVKNRTDDFLRHDFQAVGGVDFELFRWLVLDARAAYSFVPINQKFYNFTLYGTLHLYYWEH